MRLRQLLTFSSRERAGLLVILAIILAITGLQAIKLVYPSPSCNTEPLPEHEWKRHARHKRFVKHEKHRFTPRENQRFEFDPNTLSVDSFILLGLSRKQAETIDKYRQRKGTFRTADDFSKMYTVSPKLFAQLEPFIRIKTIANKRQGTKREEHVIKPVDLNTATAAELEQLPGIGQKRSAAIVEKREKLGGFYSINQLVGIKMISRELVDSLQRRLSADSSLVRKIDINQATFADLKAHPCFGYFTTKKILDYKKIQGSIENVHELLDNKIVDSSTFERIRHYLTVKR